MRARSVTARVTIAIRSSTADGSTFSFAPDPLTADQRSTGFAENPLSGGTGFRFRLDGSQVRSAMPRTLHRSTTPVCDEVTADLVVLLSRNR